MKMGPQCGWPLAASRRCSWCRAGDQLVWSNTTAPSMLRSLPGSSASSTLLSCQPPHMRPSRMPASTISRSNISVQAGDAIPSCARASTWTGLLAGSPKGVIHGPASNGTVSWVSRDDLADVTVSVLTTGGHDGASYDITGSQALTLAQA